MRGGIGDEMVCFSTYCVLKVLYPKALCREEEKNILA